MFGTEMNEICRTCLLPNGNLDSLFEWKLAGNQITTLAKIISLCTGLEISKYDNFSNVICVLCSSTLLQAFEYRRKCWDAHRTLLRKYNKTHEEIKSDNISDTAYQDTEHNDADKQGVNDTLDQLNEALEEIETKDSCENLSTITEDRLDDGMSIEAVSLSDTTTIDDCKVVPMSDFLLYVEHKIDKTRHFGRMFTCRTCPQAYENQHYMVNHIKKAHKIVFKLEQEYKCNICPKVYGEKSLYLRHLRWHSNKTSYICTYCGVKLKYKFTLMEHIRVHTGEKPHKCDYCDFRSGKRSVMIIHTRTHTGERPFLCHICNQRCPTTAARATHVKTHATDYKYECNICNKKFRTPGVLSTHKLIHDPSKHKECHVCGKHFPRQTQLKAHMRVHTREYCYKCSECGKGFIQRHCWRTHMKNHHNQIL